MVHEMLSIGEDSPMTAAALCNYFGIKRQHLSQIIYKERREGWPICAQSVGNYGYYLAADAGELRRFCNRLGHRSAEINATRAALEKLIPELPEPEDADGVTV